MPRLTSRGAGAWGGLPGSGGTARDHGQVEGCSRSAEHPAAAWLTNR
jgi:hypothetical protein